VRCEEPRSLAEQLPIRDAPRGLLASAAHEAASVDHSGAPERAGVVGVISFDCTKVNSISRL
jgi:hypothetical protein